MKTNSIFRFISAVLLSVVFFQPSAYAVDLGQIEKDLAEKGVEGWIHGSVADRDLYVLTYRAPGDFFDYVELSLTTDSPEIAKRLPSFGRHDKVRIKGSFLRNPSPQKHVSLTSLELVKKFTSGYAVAPYQHQAKIPADLFSAGVADFLVHAIAGDGHVLVLEYRDQIVPMFVKNGELTKNLFRNDLVRLHYKLMVDPESPTHLSLDESAAEPLKVLESIQALHGKPAEVEGALIMFPKSPEILFNVFAIKQEIAGTGLNRQFTIMNFDDPKVFAKVRENLQKAWDKYPRQFDNGRNKLISRRLRVKAKGTFNEIDANQANPQVLITSPDSVTVIE